MININLCSFDLIFQSSFKVQLVIHALIIYQADDIADPQEPQLVLLLQPLLHDLIDLLLLIWIVHMCIVDAAVVLAHCGLFLAYF